MGSGFLISAPVLAGVVGKHAVISMAFLLLAAYVIGYSVRFNIKHFEPVEDLKGIALAMQFNPNAIISKNDFIKLHTLFGDKPVLPHVPADEVKAYVEKLAQARNILRDAYGFSDALAKKW